MGQTSKVQFKLSAALSAAVFGAVAFGGQSIQLSTQSVSNSSIPAQAPGNPWRVEFSIHDWNANASNGHISDGTAVGADIEFLNISSGDVRLQVFSRTASGGSVCQINGLGPNGPSGGSSLYTNRFMTVRYQEDPVAKVDYCQAWDINGNMVANSSQPYTSNSGMNFPGASVASTGQNLSTAYFRLYTCTVPLNSRPPVTADTNACALVNWKFDGNLNDSSGNGYTAQISSGSPVFVATPGQNLVVPELQILNTPAWGNTASFRAGFAGQLNGLASYSQADASASVQCVWQVASGPSIAIFDNRNSCTPTTRGLIFGDYSFQLSVTDVNGNRASATQDIGAVSTDTNGVVVNANPIVDALFGPMIALGQNPWGYQDYWSLHATTLRNGDYAAPVISQNQSYPGWSTNGKPQWETPGQGTVSYYWNGAGCIGDSRGSCASTGGTTLASALNATDTTISVASTSGLDLTVFPTRIIVLSGGNWDELRVCSTSGTTLILCYDPSALSRHSFSSGAQVIQSKLTGSSTKFISDPNSAVCPLGAPGLPGLSNYSAGTAALTAGSPTLTGIGTSWTQANGVIQGNFVQVLATHSGTPFTFMAQIASVNSSTGITLARPFPSDADSASGLSYNIMAASRTIALHYQNTFTDPNFDPTGDSILMFGTTGCESETAAYLNPEGAGLGNSFASYHDIPSLDGRHFLNQQYSITDTTGWVNESSAGGINFYGEDIAHWALYYRSGLNLAKTTAQSMSNYWVHSPWGNPDGSGYPRLFLGGAVLGAWISYLTDPATKVSISNLRGYANLGVAEVNGLSAAGCNAYDDTRDAGWAFSWVILAATYDPDTTSASAPGGIPWRTYWQNALAAMQADDTNCERSDHSWSNGFYWNSNLPAVTLTNGSTAGTGAALPSSMCNGTAMGEATVGNGSATVNVISGSIPSGATALAFYGTSGGQPFSASYAIGGSGSSAVLAVLWPGDSGTVTWMSTAQVPDVTNNATGSMEQQIAFGTGNNDIADLAVNYACMYNSSSSFTLSSPWMGTSSSSLSSGQSFHAYGENLSGYGQQPFFLGIKALGMNYLAKQTVPALTSYATSYTQFTRDAVQWIHDIGYDSNTQGTFYGRVFGYCEPNAPINPAAHLGFRQSGCSFGNTQGTIIQSREQNSEIGTAAALYYEFSPTAPNRTWGDTVYGSLWGSPFNVSGVYQDVNSVAANVNQSNLLDSYIHAGKWTGFFAGAGMSHRWPAERLGGVRPPVLRRIDIGYVSGAITGAQSAQIVVTAPSGLQTTFPCAGSPCQVTVDDRQGTHLYKIQYLGASGRVVSQADTALLY